MSLLARRVQLPESDATPALGRPTKAAGIERHIMLRRILTTTATAATLLAAAPLLAEESNKQVEPEKVPPCCERMAKLVRERVDRVEKKGTKEQRRQEFVPPAGGYDPVSAGG